VICCCYRSSGANGDFAVKQGELFAGQALQPAHQPSRHIGTPPAQQWLPSPSGFSPSYGELGFQKCWRDAIVVGRDRKSSASFGRRKPAAIKSGYVLMR
jgi:hypothetical protein